MLLNFLHRQRKKRAPFWYVTHARLVAGVGYVTRYGMWECNTICVTLLRLYISVFIRFLFTTATRP